jgi:hypothetical protein
MIAPGVQMAILEASPVLAGHDDFRWHEVYHVADSYPMRKACGCGVVYMTLDRTLDLHGRTLRYGVDGSARAVLWRWEA